MVAVGVLVGVLAVSISRCFDAFYRLDMMDKAQ